MLNKILEFEKDALKDRVHEGISIGIAIEDHESVKLKVRVLFLICL